MKINYEIEQNKNISDEDLFEAIKNHFICSPGNDPIVSRGFILPDGTFVSTKEKHPKQDGWVATNHGTIEDWLIDNGYSLDCEASGDDYILEYRGCIRINGGNEFFIVIPKQPLTPDQYEALENFLNEYITYKSKAFDVSCANGQNVDFWVKGVSASSIIHMIRNFYLTGAFNINHLK